MKPETKFTHGGARKGAGRKPRLMVKCSRCKQKIPVSRFQKHTADCYAEV